MANFPRVWPTGIADDMPVTGSELTTLDENISKAPNFSEGSDHEPTAPITVTGSYGFGNINISGNAYILGTGNLYVADDGDIVLEDGADILLLDGADIIVQSGARIMVQPGGLITYVGGYQGKTFFEPASPQEITGWTPRGYPNAGHVQSTGAITEWCVWSTHRTPRVVDATAVTVSVKGAGSHSWPIQFPPILQLLEVEADGSMTLLGSATDPSTNAAEYQVVHPISITLDPVVAMGGDKPRLVRLQGEGGTNALPGLEVYKGWIDWTTTKATHE